MLKTLVDITEVGGYKIIDMDKLREAYPYKFNESGSMDYIWFEKEIRPNAFIYIRNDKNSISFTLQNGPIKENGINGCQVDQIIEVAKLMIEGLNKQIPCRENSCAITKLDEALHWLNHRKQDREKRKVEGTNNV